MKLKRTRNIDIFATLVFGVLVFFLLGGFRLALAYSMIWIDRVILGAFFIKSGIASVARIEFVSIAIIYVGMNFSMTSSFLFCFFVPLLADSIRQAIMPTDTGYFIFPGAYNFLDGASAVFANIAKGYGLFTLMAGVQVIRHIIGHYYERVSDPSSPIMITTVVQIIFNMALALYLSDWSVFAAV